MNPTVEAAWIAASVGFLSLSATVVIAIVGYRNTRKVAIEAARNERLIGKLADTYEGVLTALIRRQAERREAATFYRSPDAEKRMRAFGEEDPNWSEAQGRVAAYSSPEVRRGLDLVRRADQEVAMQFTMWQSAKRQASKARESGTVVQELPSSGEFREQMNQVLELAEKIEDALIDLIRAELQGRSTASPIERLNALANNHRMRFAAIDR